MWLEPQHLEKIITGETGLDLEAGTGTDTEGQRWYLLRPRGLPNDYTFAIRTTLGWRRLRIDFEPGKFAGELLTDMGHADETGRAAFRAVLTDCRNLGAQIDLQINGNPHRFDGEDLWAHSWKRLTLSINKGQLELGAEDGEPDADIICRWTGRLAAAIVSILPLEEDSEAAEPDVAGYPEGALTTVKANRYERDRRNRAAAISIHGSSCLGCGIDMGTRYGEVAEGFIEIHHVTPVSQLGVGHVIDPTRDLVPLCPNCHAVTHRRTPPLSLEEIRRLLRQS